MLVHMLNPQSVKRSTAVCKEISKSIKFMESMCSISNKDYEHFMLRQLETCSDRSVYSSLKDHAGCCYNMLNTIYTSLNSELKSIKSDKRLMEYSASLDSRWKSHCSQTFDPKLKNDLDKILENWNDVLNHLVEKFKEADDTGGYSSYSAYSDDDDGSSSDDESDDDSSSS